MSDFDTFVYTLQCALSAEQVITDTNILRETTVDGIEPRLVVTPYTVDEVSQIVAVTNQYEMKLLVRGGGSRMNSGEVPEHIDVLLETRGLSRLLEHERSDLTCHVEAGLTLTELQNQIATAGQRLPLDPPDAQQTSIGGILASNASGPKRLRYGTAHDLVRGLRVVQSNGVVSSSSNSIVKNTANDDFNKLYVGSLGTLGIIVEANLKLSLIPAAEHTLLLTYAHIDDAMQTAVAITNSLLTPSALELIDAGAARDMADFFGLNLPTNGYTLAINFEGSPAILERQIDESQLLARLHNALISDDIVGFEQERFWEVVREHTRGTLTCKVSLLVARVASYIKLVEQVCRQYSLEAAIVAHAGNGILYIELRPADATIRLVEAIMTLHRYAQEARGSLVMERCPTDLKRRINVWDESNTKFSLIKRLKKQLDPKDIFVSGRFLGGL